MVFIKKLLKSKQFLFCLIPLVLFLICILKNSVLCLILAIISPFIIVGAVPAFKKRENLWMFLIVAITGIPVNLLFIYFLISEFGLDMILYDVLYGSLLYFVLFSIEQLLYGIITRFIYRKQLKMFSEVLSLL